MEGSSNTLAPEIMKKQINVNDFELVGPVKDTTDTFIVKQGLHKYTKKQYINIDEEFLIHEIGILAQLDHPTILSFKGFYLSKDPKIPSVIITGASPNGNLKNMIAKEVAEEAPAEWNITKKYICLYGIAKGLEYCHSRNVVHRSICPENIQLDESFEPKISNFDMAKLTEKEINEASRLITAPFYTAPEYIRDHIYSSKMDVYSFGVLVFFVFVGRIPFSKHENNAYKYYQTVKDGKRDTESIPEDLPSGLRSIIECCWSQNQDSRPTFTDIVKVLEDTSNFPKGVELQAFEDYAKRIGNYSGEETTTDHYSDEQIFEHFSKLANDDIYTYFEKEKVKTKKRPFETKGLKPFAYGQFGTLFNVQDGDKQYALKTVSVNMNNPLYIFIREISIMSRLDHPAVLSLHGFIFPPEKEGVGMLVMDLMKVDLEIQVLVENEILLKDLTTKAESLTDEEKKVFLVLQDNKKTMQDITIFNVQKKLKTLPENRPVWDITQKAIVIYGLAAAMDYCHDREILHRDLKPANILLDDHLEPYVCDFGISKVIDKNSSDPVSMSLAMGTPYYTSPEWMNESKCTFSADVYSFAGIMFFILVGRHPLQTKKDSPYTFQMEVIKGTRDKVPDTVPEFYKDLIEKCWADAPSARPIFNTIVKALLEGTKTIPGIDSARFDAYVEKLKKYHPCTQIDGFDTIMAKLLNKSSQENNDKIIANALSLISNGQFAEAANQFKIAMQNGDYRGYFHYAKLLTTGDGVKRSLPLAIENFTTALKIASDENVPIKAKNEIRIELGKVYEILSEFSKAATIYKAAKKDGSFLGQTLYARIIAYGKGRKLNKKKAIKYLKESQNHAKDDGGLSYASLGQLCLDEMYAGNPYELFTQAEKYKCPQAYAGLGLCYLRGLGVAKDTSKAIINFAKGTVKEDMDSFLHLARIYKEGIDIKPDPKFAISLLEKASRFGCPQADFELGMLYMAEKDENKGIEYLQKACDNGHKQATFELGMFHKNRSALAIGDAKRESFNTAASYFQILAKKNYYPGMRELGLLHYKKLISSSNDKDALYYIKEAADNGDDIAQLTLGVLYESGNLVELDLDKAKFFLQLAAEQGNEQAIERLANFTDN